MSHEPLPDTHDSTRREGSAGEVFSVFLRLGVTSFGGPVAHLGYFHDEIVSRRKWMSEKAYADLVALCQFLPGPASSQVGMGIGLQRAGLLGMFAAWCGFTLPSVFILVAFALGIASFADISQAGWLTGLKAAAVAVVAHAVLTMTKSLVTDKARAAIAVGALVLVVLIPHPLIQVGAISLGALTGFAALRRAPGDEVEPTTEPSGFATRIPTSLGVASLSLFALLLLALPLLARAGNGVAILIFDSFYRAGALVFGGGHVVLPLLEQATVRDGLVDHDTFLAGYGAAQAVPGPLFTFASYLGASADGISWWWGALVATVAIFLPAALLVVGCLPFWDDLRRHPAATPVLAGANAAVVGILGAALYNPVMTSGIHGPATVALAVVAFTALTSWKVPAWAVVITAALVGQIAL